MKILWVATKPPWPPVDGGRLLMALSIAGLVEAGQKVVVVAPHDPHQSPEVPLDLRAGCQAHWVDAPAPALLATLARARLRNQAFSIQRHARPAVARQVASCLASTAFDLVHVEQVQALSSCAAAFSAHLPVVLRAQNVESELWAGMSRDGGLRGPWLGGEARRLADYEGHSCRRVHRTITLTARDAARLRVLAGDSADIRYLPIPFPAELPGATAPLPGDPALVLFGSRGWWPNRDGADWLLTDIWPGVRARLPGARLHLFTDSRMRVLPAGVTRYEAPQDSQAAFAPGSIHLVALRTASGIRMRILEAWARGIPVVATVEAAAGLDRGADEALLIAGDASQFARAVQRLHRDSDLRHRLVTQGRSLLKRIHDPHRAQEQLLAVYRGVRERT